VCRESRQPCWARCFAAMSEVLELEGLKLGASIVERDLQSAEGAHGLFDERDDVILSGDISSHEKGASTGRSNLLGELLSLGNAASGDDHVRALANARAVALPMHEVPPVIRDSVVK
jgi:hypothetical protein